MKFEIKRVEIIDDPGSRTDIPQIAQCHVEIGDEGSSDADIFFVDVCNPRWAEDHLDPDGETPDPSVLIVQEVNEKNIRERIEEEFLSCDYSSFDELVSRSAPLMRWEFA